MFIALLLILYYMGIYYYYYHEARVSVTTLLSQLSSFSKLCSANLVVFLSGKRSISVFTQAYLEWTMLLSWDEVYNCFKILLHCHEAVYSDAC